MNCFTFLFFLFVVSEVSKAGDIYPWHFHYFWNMSAFEMDEPFDLPVEYKGKEIILPSQLARRGYSYKIHVEAGGQDIIFEPDEERNFRALLENQMNTPVSMDIIRAIGEALDKHLR